MRARARSGALSGGAAAAAGLIGALAAGVGCQTLLSSDERAASSDSGPESGPDGSTDAGGARSEAGGPFDAGLTNLIANPGFEDGTGACGTSWSVGGGVVADKSREAHSGLYSCGLPAGGRAFATPIPLTGGRSYYAEMWVRARPGSAGGNAVIALQASFPDGGREDLYPFNWLPVLDTWTRHQSTFQMPRDATAAVASVAFEGSAAEVALFDDVLLSAQ